MLHYGMSSGQSIQYSPEANPRGPVKNPRVSPKDSISVAVINPTDSVLSSRGIGHRKSIKSPRLRPTDLFLSSSRTSLRESKTNPRNLRVSPTRTDSIKGPANFSVWELLTTDSVVYSPSTTDWKSLTSALITPKDLELGPPNVTLKKPVTEPRVTPRTSLLSFSGTTPSDSILVATINPQDSIPSVSESIAHESTTSRHRTVGSLTNRPEISPKTSILRQWISPIRSTMVSKHRKSVSCRDSVGSNGSRYLKPSGTDRLTRPVMREKIVEQLKVIVEGRDEQELFHRATAQEKIIYYQKYAEFPLIVSEIISDPQHSKDERYLAAVCLKNYFRAVLNNRQKNVALFSKGYGLTVLESLFKNLESPYADMRDTLATCIALLLTIGFWNNGAFTLKEMFFTRDPSEISNVAHVLNKSIDEEYIKSTEQHMAKQWFDILHDILKMDHLPSPARAFTLRPLYLLTKFHLSNPNVLQQHLAKAVETFRKVLLEDNSGHSEFALKLEILKFLNESLVEFAEHTDLIMPLAPIISFMMRIHSKLFKRIVRGSETAPRDPSEGRGEPRNFFGLSGCLVNFILKLVELSYLDFMVKDMSNIIYCAYIFMSCHSEMERHIYRCITDGEDKHFYWLRDSCRQVLVRFAHKLKRRPDDIKQYFKTTDEVFQRLNQELDPGYGDTRSQTKISRILYMSRLTESMVYGLGSVKDYLDLADPQFPFPLNQYLNNWVDLMDHCNPMLKGRIIWFGGLFCTATELTSSIVDRHFRVITESISVMPSYLSFPATEALCQYYQNFKKLDEEKAHVVTQYSKRVIQSLVRGCKNIAHPELVHGLRALGFLVKTHKELVKPNIGAISDMLLKTIIPCSKNSNLKAAMNFLVAKLGHAKALKNSPERNSFLQFLLHWICNQKPLELADDLDFGFDLLNSIFLYGSINDPTFILQIFTAAVTRIILNKERNLSLDEGAGRLLTTVVVKLGSQFKVLCNSIGAVLIISQIPKLINSLVSPDVEFPGHVLGKLVIVFLYYMPDLLRLHYETILKNIASCVKPDCKKAKANWLIFIFICMHHTDETVKILSDLPGPNEESALHFILQLWTPMDYLSIGIIERKLLVYSLSHVISKLLSGNSAGRKGLESVVLDFVYPHDEFPTPKDLNGLEHLAYLLISCLLCENELVKRGEKRVSCDDDFDYDDLGDDPDTVRSDEDLFLFRNHEFNIDVIRELPMFFRSSPNTEYYLGILHYFYPETAWIILKGLGCPIPEMEFEATEDLYVEEA